MSVILQYHLFYESIKPQVLSKKAKNIYIEQHWNWINVYIFLKLYLPKKKKKKKMLVERDLCKLRRRTNCVNIRSEYHIRLLIKSHKMNVYKQQNNTFLDKITWKSLTELGSVSKLSLWLIDGHGLFHPSNLSIMEYVLIRCTII